MSITAYKITNNSIYTLSVIPPTLDDLTRGLPDGFYTTFTTHSGGTRVLGLRDHLDRLYKPAGKLKLRPAVEETRLREQIADLVKSNLPHESRIRLVLTRSTGEVFVGIQPFKALRASIYTIGVHVITSEMSRSDPRIKDSAFITASANQRRQLKGEIFEVLLTRKGRLLEGMTSNFYAVKGGVLITAQQGVLLGVTRKAILRLARGQGMRIAFRAPVLDEKFDEAFLTSSSRGVVPIVSINHFRVGKGRVGVWTKSIMKAYREYVEKRSESLAGEGFKSSVIFLEDIMISLIQFVVG